MMTYLYFVGGLGQNAANYLVNFARGALSGSSKLKSGLLVV